MSAAWPDKLPLLGVTGRVTEGWRTVITDAISGAAWKVEIPPCSSRTAWFLPAPSLALQSTQKLASLSLLWIPYLLNMTRIHFGCLPQKPHGRKQQKGDRKRQEKGLLRKEDGPVPENSIILSTITSTDQKDMVPWIHISTVGLREVFWWTVLQLNVSVGGDETF